MLITLAIIIILLTLLYKYLIWNYDYWQKRDVPGPKPILIFGNFFYSTLQRKNFVCELDEIYQKFKKSGNFIGVFTNRTPQIVILDPELIRNVLIKNFKNFQDNEFAGLTNKDIDPLLAANPFMLSGNDWSEKRAEISPVFTNVKIRAIYPIMIDVCKKMTQYIDNEIARSKPCNFEVREIAAKYTTDVVSTCIYGLNSISFVDENSIFRQMAIEMFQYNPWILIYYAVIQTIPFIRKIWKIKFISKKVEHFFVHIMNEAIKIRESETLIRDDFLNHFLELRQKKQLTNYDLVGHTVTFFLDGIETSSLAIAYSLFEIAKNTEVQNRLRTEIENLCQTPNMDQLMNMQFLDQIFNETIRLHPPGIAISRKCTESIKLPLHKKNQYVKIDKNMTIIIPMYSIQRDEQYFNDPEEFQPDRFAPENGGIKKYRDQGVFLPFSEGPRSCLGMKFANIQVKLAIVEIIRNFNVTINEKTKLPLTIDPKDFMLTPMGGIHLNFERI